jgi:hypothetical protein
LDETRSAGISNQPLEPIARSAAMFLIQIERLWRAPRDGSADR